VDGKERPLEKGRKDNGVDDGKVALSVSLHPQRIRLYWKG